MGQLDFAWMLGRVSGEIYFTVEAMHMEIANSSLTLVSQDLR